jgi:type I site-specific restriction-modification system R (restriction) subunit
VVLADEAHRSQYGFLDGGARWMREAIPNATFVGFTGTPLEKDDKSTPAVFGDKPGGVVVGFLGIADQLRDAVQTYTQAGGEGSPVEDIQNEAVPFRK